MSDSRCDRSPRAADFARSLEIRRKLEQWAAYAMVLLASVASVASACGFSSISAESEWRPLLLPADGSAVRIPLSVRASGRLIDGRLRLRSRASTQPIRVVTTMFDPPSEVTIVLVVNKAGLDFDIPQLASPQAATADFQLALSLETSAPQPVQLELATSFTAELASCTDVPGWIDVSSTGP